LGDHGPAGVAFGAASSYPHSRDRRDCTPPDDGSDGPDNISVSPYGGVILAEDCSAGNHLVGAAEDGTTFRLARSERGDEFTGPVFSQDGRILFANIQVPGTMFAINGPWG
jgi:secreted PhoX family phosphatase